MNLISGLLIPNTGKILIDNIDIRQDVDGFLKTLSYVTQFNYFEIVLLKIYVLKNISLKEKELKIFFICGLNNIIKNLIKFYL